MDRRSLFLLSLLLPITVMLPFALRAIVDGVSLPSLPAASPRQPAVARVVRRAPRAAPHSAAPVAPVAAAPVVSSSREESRILELFAQNATCPLLESRLTTRAPIPFLYRLLAQTRRGGPLPPEVLDAYIRAAASSSENEFHLALESVAHPFLRLTDAAAYLGLLRGRVPVARAPEAAIPLLRDLVAELPANAVPALLLAYALRELGDPAFADVLARALERPGFQTYAEEALQSIYGPAVDQPSLLPAALGVSEQAPLLDLLPVEDLVLDRLLDEDRGYAENALAFGRRLMRFEAARSAREDILFWSSLNYTIGQRTARGAWKKLHPELGFPGELRVPRERLLARSGALLRISDRHFAHQEKTERNLALCEEALPRYAQELRREWGAVVAE